MAAVAGKYILIMGSAILFGARLWSVLVINTIVIHILFNYYRADFFWQRLRSMSIFTIHSLSMHFVRSQKSADAGASCHLTHADKWSRDTPPLFIFDETTVFLVSCRRKLPSLRTKGGNSTYTRADAFSSWIKPAAWLSSGVHVWWPCCSCLLDFMQFIPR